MQHSLFVVVKKNRRLERTMNLLEGGKGGWGREGGEGTEGGWGGDVGERGRLFKMSKSSDCMVFF